MTPSGRPPRPLRSVLRALRSIRNPYITGLTQWVEGAEEASAISRESRGSLGVATPSDKRGGLGYGAASVPYDASAVPPSGRSAGGAAPAGVVGQPDGGRAGRAVRDGAHPAGGAPHPDAHQRGAAGALP